MTSNIFRKASIKLTVVYLAIIMCLSLVFSISLYRVSVQEVQRGIRDIRLQGPARLLLNPDLLDEFRQEQDDAIAHARQRIINNLILTNVAIFLGGGILSYYLARKSLEPIEQAHEAQSRFTADASHELRTPITAMRAETELTLTEDKLTLTKAKDQLKSNIEELDKLTALSEGLLQLARLDNNDFEKDHVSLSHVIQQAVELTQNKAAHKSQTIKVGTVPDMQVHANQPALIQAVVVLLDNAVKYSPEKSQIKVSAKSLKNSVTISIADKGIGIRSSDLPHIFDRFYRADNSRNKKHASGYGIGLSIAKAIVDLHNGDLTVKSTPNKGSTFKISLPL